MSQSKNHNNHKERLQNFKNQQKLKKMSENQRKLPETREVPVWNPNEVFEINGRELELINNFIFSVGDAFTTCQSIMQRNVLSGKVKIEFDKLVANPDGSPAYVRMSEEEAKPKKEEFAKALDLIRNIPKQAQVQSETPPTEQPTVVEELPTVSPTE